MDMCNAVLLSIIKGNVKLSLCLTNSTLRHEDVWGSVCIDPDFWTTTFVEGDWSASRPYLFTPG
jgi:hypothetical protein